MLFSHSHSAAAAEAAHCRVLSIPTLEHLYTHLLERTLQTTPSLLSSSFPYNNRRSSSFSVFRRPGSSLVCFLSSSTAPARLFAEGFAVLRNCFLSSTAPARLFAEGFALLRNSIESSFVSFRLQPPRVYSQRVSLYSETVSFRLQPPRVYSQRVSLHSETRRCAKESYLASKTSNLLELGLNNKPLRLVRVNLHPTTTGEIFC